MLTESLSDRLWKAQEGLCFLCAKPMGMGRRTKLNINGWTREHVYPKATTGRGLIHNIVLAHGHCNADKGSRQPSNEELLRVSALYDALGLIPFVRTAPDGHALTPIENRRRAEAVQQYWKNGELLTVSGKRVKWRSVAKSVDATDLKSVGVSRRGSSPRAPTIYDDEPIMPPVKGDALAAWARLERGALIMSRRLNVGEASARAAIEGLAQQFSDLRAAQLIRHFGAVA